MSNVRGSFAHPARAARTAARCIARTPALVLALAGLVGLVSMSPPAPVAAQSGGCFSQYVATGDAVAAGAGLPAAQSYPGRLLNDHLKRVNPTWCLINVAAPGATSSGYSPGNNSQLALAHRAQPELITITLGQQDPTIVGMVDTCMTELKNLDIRGARACIEAIESDTVLWNAFRNNLNSILSAYRQLAGRAHPNLVVAVTNYYNPYPSSEGIDARIAGACALVPSVSVSCGMHFVDPIIGSGNLGETLDAADRVIRKLNTTIASVMQPVTQGTQGRFVLVDIYPRFREHCTALDVRLHDFWILRLPPAPPLPISENGLVPAVIPFPSPLPFEPGIPNPVTGAFVPFGCSDWGVVIESNSWMQEGPTATGFVGIFPFNFLPPGVPPPVTELPGGIPLTGNWALNPGQSLIGFFVEADYEVRNVGVHPNATGQKCIADLIWEAVKQKLGVPEAPRTPAC
jgi:lysophospholipase L1-like esterase